MIKPFKPSLKLTYKKSCNSQVTSHTTRQPSVFCHWCVYHTLKSTALEPSEITIHNRHLIFK